MPIIKDEIGALKKNSANVLKTLNSWSATNWEARKTKPKKVPVLPVVRQMTMTAMIPETLAVQAFMEKRKTPVAKNMRCWLASTHIVLPLTDCEVA